MGAEKVHQGEKRLRGIALPQSLQRFTERIGIDAGEIGDEGCAEGVVHNAVQLPAQKIAAALRIGNFCGGVLPDLADEGGVRVCFLHSGAEGGDEIIRQLIGHIQPPAGGPGPEPAAHHGVFIMDDEVSVGGAVLPDSGEGFDAPPCVIVRGPRVKAEPVEIGGSLALSRAGIRVEAIGVEIAALGAGMVKNAI